MPRDKKKERRTKFEKEKHTLEMILGKNSTKAYKGMSLPEYTVTSHLVTPTRRSCGFENGRAVEIHMSSYLSDLRQCFPT